VMPRFVSFFFLLSIFFFSISAILFQILINIKSDFSYIISLESNPKEPHITYPSNSSQITPKNISNTILRLLFTSEEQPPKLLKFSSLFHLRILPFCYTIYNSIFTNIFQSFPTKILACLKP
jgi:hypothetical protein